MASKDGSGVWDPAHRHLTIGLLLSVSLTAFESMAVATILPAAAADLAGGDLAWYGWVFSAFMLANLVGIPAAGVMSDRGGPVRPFVVGCSFFGAGLLLAGLSSSMPWLVAWRVAQGFGAGAISSVAYVAIARGYAAHAQPRMLALVASAWVVPGLLAPSVAALIAGALGWRAVFLALVPMTVIAAVLSVRGLAAMSASSEPEAGTAAKDSARAHVAASLELAAGAVLALGAAGAASAAIAIVGASFGAVIAARALARLLPAGSLRAAPGAPAALAAKALVTFAFFGAEAFLPLSLTVVRGRSLTMAGLALTTGTLAWTSGAWIQERTAGRADRLVVVRTGIFLVAAGVVGAASLVVCPRPAMVAIASWASAGLGIGLCYSALTLSVFDATSRGDEGVAAAALQLANVLGIALGTGIAGAAVAAATRSGRSEAVGIVVADGFMLAAAAAGLWAAGRIATKDGPEVGFCPQPAEARPSASAS